MTPFPLASRLVSIVGLVVVTAGLGGCSREAATTATTVDPMTTWCDIAAEMTSFADEQASATNTAADAEKVALDRLGALLNQGRAVAPPEIEADVAVAADRVAEVADLLGSVNFDDSLLSDELLTRYDQAGQELAQASAVITDFNRRYCGVGTDDPSRNEAIAQLVADGFSPAEASCLYESIATANVTAATAESTSNAQVDIEAIFTSCGIDPTRIAEYGSLTNEQSEAP